MGIHHRLLIITIVVFAAAAVVVVVSAIIPFGLLFAFDDPLLISFHDKDLYSALHASVFSSADRVRHRNTMYVLPSTDILRLIVLGTETLCMFFHLLIFFG